MVQLEELLAVRHSVFVLGPAGTGKTQVIKTLNKTYQNQKRKPLLHDINPKAVTADELFGFINPSTREWKDGEIHIHVSTQKEIYSVVVTRVSFKEQFSCCLKLYRSVRLLRTGKFIFCHIIIPALAACALVLRYPCIRRTLWSTACQKIENEPENSVQPHKTGFNCMTSIKTHRET